MCRSKAYLGLSPQVVSSSALPLTEPFGTVQGEGYSCESEGEGKGGECGVESELVLCVGKTLAISSVMQVSPLISVHGILALFILCHYLCIALLSCRFHSRPPHIYQVGGIYTLE